MGKPEAAVSDQQGRYRGFGVKAGPGEAASPFGEDRPDRTSDLGGRSRAHPLRGTCKEGATIARRPSNAAARLLNPPGNKDGRLVFVAPSQSGELRQLKWPALICALFSFGLLVSAME